jgi:uncharacterized protein (TIGR03435 family)
MLRLNTGDAHSAVVMGTIVAAIVGIEVMAIGQTRVASEATAQQSFEVASIKLNQSGSRQSNFIVTPGRLTATNVSVYQMISMSHSQGAPLPAGAITGGSTWVRTDHYNIVAKAEGEPSPDQVREMIRTLLADRFQLRMHRESTERPIYVLTLARKEGSLGTRVRRTDVRCPGDPGADSGVPPPVPGADPAAQACQLRIFPGRLTGRAITMEQLAKALVGAVDDHRETRNQTGLEGRFDVDLEWTPNPDLPLPPRDFDAPPLPPVDPNAPSLFTAIQEQLALRLESRKDSVEVLVIDRVERPSID